MQREMKGKKKRRESEVFYRRKLQTLRPNCTACYLIEKVFLGPYLLFRTKIFVCAPCKEDFKSPALSCPCLSFFSLSL